MAFEIQDYYDLVRLLYQHPEWQEELRNILISKDIRELPQLVRELTEAHKRSEARLSGVEERLTRLEQAVAELTEAHKRSEARLSGVEERLTRLEQAVAELTEAQKRSEARLSAVETRLDRVEIRLDRVETRLDRVEQKVDRLGEELGGLKATIGSSLEDEASSMLEFVMRQKGYRLLSEAVLVRLNGEVDAALKAVSPEGEPVSVVMESKARLGARDVIRWSQRMRSADFQKRLAKAGYPAPYLVYAYGIRVDAAARQAVQEAGIGLIRGEGEVFPPRGWLQDA